MASEITVTLSGSESEAQFNGANAWLRNDGAATVYAAKTSGVTAGADGTVAVPAGGSAPVYGANGRVFLLGTGSVQLIGSDYSTNPFKTATSSGGSGVDEVARAAVNAHAGNAEVHVTAAEKSAWNGKAEVSDIPTSLPANGGNADTVGGYTADGLYHSRAVATNADECVKNGNYMTAPDCLNIPIDAYGLISTEVSVDGTWILQRYTAISYTPYCYARSQTNGGAWTDWKRVGDGGNAAALRTSGEDGTPYGDSYLMAAQYNKSGDNTFRIFVTPVEGNVVWVSVDRADHAVDSDTLDGKHASEFVMHSAYDELAARVAALEVKTQTEGT